MSNLSVATRADEAANALPHALPAWVYNHSEMTRLELERILMPSWQIVCHVNSIPKAGDYETFDLGPESVLVLRDRDGSIRGFHNVCRHRGSRLLDGGGEFSAAHNLSSDRQARPGELPGPRPCGAWAAAGPYRYCVRFRLRLSRRRSAGGIEDLGQVGRGIPALPVRRDGASRTHIAGNLGRRLEYRDGQLP